ncbi:MAG TPA: alpha/beta fold hydrolase [Allosphingosinicella sp.]|nr:alpha/beta fold hydrolase [Allosphingosinicella sp.]
MLLHGWALDRTAWAPQMALADRFRLIALDRRGFGRSTAPPDLAAETDDLLRLRDALGLGRMILVGMSQGGRIALHFALAHPEAVAGLVLQGAPLDGFAPGPKEGEAIPLADYAGLVRAGRLDVMRARWAAHPLMEGHADALAGYEGRDLLAGESALPPIAHRLGEIAAPTLVVTGEDDTPWRQLVGDALAYGIAGARRARIAGGHLCNLSHPAAFNALVADFAG